MEGHKIILPNRLHHWEDDMKPYLLRLTSFSGNSLNLDNTFHVVIFSPYLCERCKVKMYEVVSESSQVCKHRYAWDTDDHYLQPAE